MPRSYKVYGSGSTGTTSFLRIEDAISPHFNAMAVSFPKEVTRVLRFLSFTTQAEMKKYMRRDGHGRKLKSVTRLRLFDKTLPRRGGLGATPNKSYAGAESTKGRGLAKAIGYDGEKLKATNMADIGWLSRSSVYYGARFQEGSTKRVTAKMKRALMVMAKKNPSHAPAFYAMMRKKHIQIPKRPVIDPVFSYMKLLYPKLAENRFRLLFGRIGKITHDIRAKNLLEYNNELVKQRTKYIEDIDRESYILYLKSRKKA